jgi:hypothetical protein
MASLLKVCLRSALLFAYTDVSAVRSPLAIKIFSTLSGVYSREGLPAVVHLPRYCDVTFYCMIMKDMLI